LPTAASISTSDAIRQSRSWRAIPHSRKAMASAIATIERRISSATGSPGATSNVPWNS
jgi:hypothetical protein